MIVDYGTHHDVRIDRQLAVGALVPFEKYVQAHG